jgi:phosphoribosylaminoimidazole-succinocarboxamide synthase
MIIADTKFEFGLAEDGTLVLMDEVLTPDSSRYWPVEGYEAAWPLGQPPQLRQAVRARLAGAGQGERQALGQDRPAPRLPQEVIAKTAPSTARRWSA